METCNTMQTMIEKLCKKHGLDPHSDDLHLKLTQEPYQPLVIESTGKNRISVAHYFEQNGDLICDPDQEFVWLWGWDHKKDIMRWYLVPLALQMSTGAYFVASKVTDGEITHFSIAQQKQQKSFATMWAKNIRAQGWLKDGIIS